MVIRLRVVPIWSVITPVITKSDDCTAAVRFVYHEYDYRPNWDDMKSYYQLIRKITIFLNQSQGNQTNHEEIVIFMIRRIMQIEEGVIRESRRLESGSKLTDYETAPCPERCA